MSDLLQAVKEVSAHAPEYVKGHNMYRGEVDELFASQLIKRLIGETAKGYRLNLARRVVDAVLDRLKIASVSVPGSDADTAKLVAIWDNNRLGMTAKTLNRTALSEGDAYMFVWGDPADEQNAEIHFRSPKTTRVFYDPENPHVKKFAAFVWTVPGADPQNPRTRVNLLYPDRIERYISRLGTKGERDQDFDQYADDDQDEWLIDNPWGEVPVFHFRTDEPYGRPEHADAYGPQNAINKLVAVHMSTVDFQGFPQRYRLRASQIADSGSNPFDDEDDELTTDTGAGDGLQAGPGTVWDLSDTQSVGSFPSADAKNFLEPINFYARAMGASTATPLRFMDPSGDVPSGESLVADDAPLAEKISDRQTWLGDEWRSMLRFALKVAGTIVESVKVSWRPVRIVTDLQGWQTVRAKIDAGVPQEVALAEAGYRSEEVEEWLQDSETTNLATRIDLVGKIAAALQGLGAAVALGVITQQQVEEVVSELLDKSVGEPTQD